MTKKNKEMESESDMESFDSDEELQQAFAKDELKRGLNLEVAPKKEFLNRKNDMKVVLEKFKQNLDWIERLDLTTKPPAPEEEDDEKASPEDKSVHDDFRRELAFYKQVQASVLEVLPKLNRLGIQTRRPDDYFAEMAKSDRHMKRIREKLIAKEISMEKSEKAKKLRQARKFGKQVQVEVLKKRAQEKKKMLEEVKKYRKGQKDKLDFMVDLEDEEKKKKTRRHQTQATQKKEQFMPNKKRQHKNERFGFGGQKKRSKSNTAESFDKMTPVESMMMKQSSRRHSGKKSAAAKKGKKQQRPGKSRRLQNKFRNKNKRRI